MKVGLLLGAHNSLPHFSDSFEQTERNTKGHKEKQRRREMREREGEREREIEKK